MKKLLTGILSLLFVVVISSCDNQNKNTENQTVVVPAEQNNESASGSLNQNDSASGSKNQSAPADQEDGTHKRGQQNIGEISGQQIVDNVSNKLNDKLILTEEQFKSLSNILSKKLVETGGDLNAKYPLETGKKMGRDIRLKSSNEISAILNPEQKEHFEKFMNK